MVWNCLPLPLYAAGWTERPVSWLVFKWLAVKPSAWQDRSPGWFSFGCSDWLVCPTCWELIYLNSSDLCWAVSPLDPSEKTLCQCFSLLSDLIMDWINWMETLQKYITPSHHSDISSIISMYFFAVLHEFLLFLNVACFVSWQVYKCSMNNRLVVTERLFVWVLHFFSYSFSIFF